MLFEPVQLRLPPVGVGEAAIRAKALNIAGDGSFDRVDDRGSWRRPIGVAEDFDASDLLGWVRAVGSEVEPEKQRVAEIVKSRARCRVVEVDYRDRPPRSEDEVAGREIVVTDDLLPAREFCVGGRVVEAANQLRRNRQGRVAE